MMASSSRATTTNSNNVVVLVPKVRKQTLALDVVFVEDEATGWIRGETVVRVSPPSLDFESEEREREGAMNETNEEEALRKRRKVRALVFHAEKDLVEIDSIEIDGQKGRARRIFDDDVNYDVVGKNAALSFDDSIVERIKLMKDVEDESLVLANDDDASAPRASSSSSSSSSRSSGASIVLVELESGEEIDFNSREDDKDATMNDAEDEEGMEEEMVNKQKNNGREVEIVMRFRSGNYPSSVSNVNAANDGGIVAIDSSSAS